MSNLQAINLMLSGAGASLMLLLAVKFYICKMRTCVEISGLTFCILAAFHMLSDHTVSLQSQTMIGQFLTVAGSLDTAVFWVLAQTLFDDKFRLKRRHILPMAAIAATWALPYGVWVRDAVIIGLMLHVVVIGLRDYRADLVDTRRRFRMALVVLVPFMVVTTTISSLLLPTDSEIMALVNAAKFAGLAMLFAVWLTELDDTLVNGDMPDQPSVPQGATVADRLELERVRQMAAQGACFETGLTISAFAARVDIPEHRLRRLINQGLGYRNFAAFVNDHRIAEAKRRLADPGQAREQIVSHAFALGYNSLAPFNRAFRERVGQSPTEFRNAALEQVTA